MDLKVWLVAVNLSTILFPEEDKKVEEFTNSSSDGNNRSISPAKAEYNVFINLDEKLLSFICSKKVANSISVKDHVSHSCSNPICS